MAFIYWNAADEGEGQQAFQALGLPGHPSVVIFDDTNAEVLRTFGTIEESVLRETLQSVLPAEKQS